MNAAWRKDIRMLLPAWLVGLGLPLAPWGLLPDRADGWGWALLLATLGCALLAGSSFGPEFSHGTLGPLLVQPCDRRRLWRMKMTVLALALAPFLGVMLVVQRGWDESPPLGILCFIPLCAFCAAPAFTLRARSGLAGAILALALPALLCGLAVLLASQWMRVPLEEMSAQEARMLAWVCFGVLSLFCGSMAWLGRQSFLNFEVMEGTSSTLPLYRWLELMLARLPGGKGRTSPWLALARKELRLQQTALLMGAWFVAVVTLIWMVLPWLRPEHRATILQVPVGLLAGIIPLVMGSMAVAEERNLGVHAWQLTTPVAAWKQWWVKLIVTTGGSCALGVLLPWLALAAGHARVSEIPSPWPRDSSAGIVLLAGLQVVLTLLALYASSLSSTTLRAILGCVSLGMALSVAYQWVGWIVFPREWFVRWLERWRVAQAWDYGEVLAGGVLVFWLILLAALSFSNFKQHHITRRRRVGQALFLLGPAPFLSILGSVFLAMLVLVAMALLGWVRSQTG